MWLYHLLIVNRTICFLASDLEASRSLKTDLEEDDASSLLKSTSILWFHIINNKATIFNKQQTLSVLRRQETIFISSKKTRSNFYLL